MKNKLTHNIGLKIMSLLVAFLLWIIVLNIDDPVTTIPFNQIPVKVVNTSAITDEGKTYQILEDSDVISINVTAKRSVLNSLSKDDFVATADMTEMTSVDTVPIEVKSTKYADKISEIEPKTKILKVSIEDSVSKQLVIDVATSGTPLDGYAVGEVSTTQNIVRISGPASIISKVVKAGVNVSVTDMSTNINTTESILLYDENDKLVTSSQITYNIKEVSVNVVILKEKELPIKASYTGKPADNYIATGKISCVPETILVAGKESTLNKYSELELPSDLLDITGLTTNLEKTININNYLPSGLQLADESQSSEIKVVINIEPKQTKDIEVDLTDYEIINIPEGFKETMLSSQILLIKVNGAEENLERLNADTITGTIDFSLLGLDDYEEGTYQVPVNLNLPSGIELAEPATVNIYLAEKAGE